MIKDIELDGKIVKIEFIVPDEVRKFLNKNNIDENQLLKDYKWEGCINEDLSDENYKPRNDFETAKLVINYIHISQDNQIRVHPESYSKGKRLSSPLWHKGSFFRDFSIGYSIFAE